MKKIFSHNTKILKGIIVLVVGMVICFPFGSCYYDSKEYLFPDINTTCDTANVTYSKTIVSILDNSCLGCHYSGNTTAGAGISLEGYSNVKIYVDNGKLMGSINHKSGYSPMPKGSSKLDNCLINQFDIWINGGAPNN